MKPKNILRRLDANIEALDDHFTDKSLAIAVGLFGGVLVSGMLGSNLWLSCVICTLSSWGIAVAIDFRRHSQLFNTTGE